MNATLRTLDALAASALVGADTELDAVAERYAIAVTPEMAALIDRDNPADPIRLQFLPDARELQTRPEERSDPIGDDAHMPVPGLVHRYPDRVLLKPIHSCPVYCRFCFRREMVGPGGDAMTDEALDRSLAYIAEHPEIWEVIVTGGDPLMLSPRRIRRLVEAVAAIGHVRTMRWHSRVPVVDPDRIANDVIDALTAGDTPVWLAVHCNHPRELGQGAVAALRRLADAGVVLISQTVLLRGVNDDPSILEALMRRFVENRVRPYYLHQLDLAPGTSHFRVPLAEGQAILRALRGRLSGIAQPTYVLDIPGGYGKVPVGPRYLEDALGDYDVTDPSGTVHPYSEPPNS